MNGYELEPDEVLVERVGLEGWAVASEDGVTVALDTSLDDELRLEARVNDLVRDIQNLRKASGLEIVDRIRLWIPDAELLPFAERIAAETLARLGRARRRASAREGVTRLAVALARARARPGGARRLRQRRSRSARSRRRRCPRSRA